MNEPLTLELLRGIQFFSEFPEKYLRLIVGVARLESYPAGTVLFREGGILGHIFVIQEGAVGLEIRGKGRASHRLFTVGAGELLGWSPILGPSPMTTTGRALTPVRVVSVNASQILALCQEDTRFGSLFMQRVAQALASRLSATRHQLLEALGDELPVVVEETGGGD